MPVVIVPPQPVNYSGPTLPRKGLLPWTIPPEGPQTVPLAVSWVNDGGPNKSISVNLVSTQVKTISQIVGLYVDNIRNQAGVTFYFPDTQFVLEVPPLAFGWFPVLTSGVSFGMWSSNAVDTDQTLVQVLNYWVDPVAVSNFAFSDTPAGSMISGALTLASASQPSINLIPAGTEGIITAFQLDLIDVSVTNRLATPGAGTSIAGLSLTDAPGIGSHIFFDTGLFGSNYWAFQTVAHFEGLSLEMTNGLALNCNANSAFMTGFVLANVYWRQPS